MIYFKKVYFNHSDKADIESAFRKSATKRNRLSSLEVSTSNVGTNKRFFGYENEKALYFMRIKSSVEFLLPNIIFSLPKDETSFYYAFRLSRIATVVFFMFCVVLIAELIQVFRGIAPADDFITILILFLLFLGLVWLEFRLTLFKIRKTISPAI
ncbi:MAG TPA: hypothetical protein VFE53_00090 [Mucilaginibacter sp.]|jgi:hypothetical protein|nr:hypothetical protein [Mucilaginibacter sp.]